MANKTSNTKMSLFTLVMISSALTISVRNFPTEAETGMHMIFFALFAAIFFFIPVSLVAAELATGWPKQGGVYVWIKEAFGDRLGFVGIWLQWSYMIIGIISMLYFVGGSFAFVLAPHLTQNRFFLMIVLLVVLWGTTFFNLQGQKTSNKISTIGFLSGVLIPGILIIIFGTIYILKGNPLEINMHVTFKNLIPNLGQLSTWVLLVSFIRAFSGIEVSSCHAADVEKPKTNYPIAIFIVIVLGLFFNILGPLSVAASVPQKQISLFAGFMEAFSIFFSKFNMQWVTSIMGLLVTLGAIGGVSTWIMGPIKGLLATAKSGGLPPFFQKINKNGVPSRLLITQGIMTSLIGCTFLLMPRLNIAYWTSVATAMIIYFIMYIMMLLSGLRLRYKAPQVQRNYKIPFGNIGMWIVCIVGILTLSLGITVAFFPPAQFSIENGPLYVTSLILGVLTILVIPFIIYQFKKPSWKIVQKQK